MHHARNPRYLGNNLGAMFTIWDRSRYAHVELPTRNDPPILGTHEGYRTHDGVFAQWLGFRDLSGSRARRRRSRDKLRVFLQHPGWRPAARSSSVTRPARRIALSTKAYVALQTAVTLALSRRGCSGSRRATRPCSLVVGAALILWSLSSIGGLLDGRRYARGVEIARVAALATAAIFVAR